MAESFELELSWHLPDEISVIGISYPGRDYKLAWTFTKFLQLPFRRTEDLHYTHRGIYGVYSQYIIENQNTTFRLFQNKPLDYTLKKKRYFLPDHKGFDFILVIQDETRTVNATDLAKEIKNLYGVIYAGVIDSAMIKEQEILMFD